MGNITEGTNLSYNLTRLDFLQDPDLLSYTKAYSNISDLWDTLCIIESFHS